MVAYKESAVSKMHELIGEHDPKGILVVEEVLLKLVGSACMVPKLPSARAATDKPTAANCKTLLSTSRCQNVSHAAASLKATSHGFVGS